MYGDTMDELLSTIDQNSNINSEIKETVKECTKLIYIKLPKALPLLLKNLIDVKITFDNYNFDRIASWYDGLNNEMFLNSSYVNKDNFKNIVIEELIHLSSREFQDCDRFRVGFRDGYTNLGLSLNEGMTALLKLKVLDDDDVSVNGYNPDKDIIALLSTLFTFEKLEEMYFNSGLNELVDRYCEFTNSPDMTYILKNMDWDCNTRIKYADYDNEFKDNYIESLLFDLSNANYQNKKQCYNVFLMITKILKNRYKADLPYNIKLNIEDSINRIVGKLR